MSIALLDSEFSGAQRLFLLFAFLSNFCTPFFVIYAFIIALFRAMFNNILTELKKLFFVKKMSKN